MPGAEIIENACRQIMVALKEGRFTKDDLEFLLKFFQRIVKSTEKLLNRSSKD
jgi:hypothetical protein